MLALCELFRSSPREEKPETTKDETIEDELPTRKVRRTESQPESPEEKLHMQASSSTLPSAARELPCLYPPYSGCGMLGGNAFPFYYYHQAMQMQMQLQMQMGLQGMQGLQGMPGVPGVPGLFPLQPFQPKYPLVVAPQHYTYPNFNAPILVPDDD